MMQLTAENAEIERINFRRRFKEKHKAGFSGANEFAAWCIERLQEQNGCCDYCKTSMQLIRRIIGAVRSNDDRTIFHTFRGVRGGGIRGLNFEVDQRNPELGYGPDNCTLVCYFCNNDKSYVYAEGEYREFFGPARHAHFLSVAKRLGVAKDP